jgi:hypothetical protein
MFTVWLNFIYLGALGYHRNENRAGLRSFQLASANKSSTLVL